ncbi:von Willebrand factor-like isoform X2 [Rana temporaria]|uniref:von Willebrand factor-like isoform X2 n=1 Tax=Rana temporaria TaxID=8407 RepID=UPI001AACF506|nr:von Willebrand factor-like isoform X2 [Rana temporaria]
MENPNRTRTGSQLLCCPHPSPVWSRLHPTPYIILNPAIPDTGPADYYYPTQETDKVLVIMGPSSAFLLALIGVTFILTHGLLPVSDSECPRNQEYDECRSACYSPCGKRNPDLKCTDECITGCFCKPGFMFLEGSKKTKCVPCKPTPTVPGSQCPPDQEYNGCRSACYSPCGIRNPDLFCTDECIAGCFCKPGFMFLEGSKKTKCVPCDPTPTVPDAECPPDQEYDECRSACYSPCGQRRPDLFCTQQCITGCFCKPGFTFLEGSKKTKCVPCNPILKG